jgi:hypothetical protein
MVRMVHSCPWTASAAFPQEGDAVPIKQSAIFIGKLCVCFKQAVLKLDIVDFFGCGFDLNHGSIVKNLRFGGPRED